MLNMCQKVLESLHSLRERAMHPPRCLQKRPRNESDLVGCAPPASAHELAFTLDTDWKIWEASAAFSPRKESAVTRGLGI